MPTFGASSATSFAAPGLLVFRSEGGNNGPMYAEVQPDSMEAGPDSVHGSAWGWTDLEHWDSWCVENGGTPSLGLVKICGEGCRPQVHPLPPGWSGAEAEADGGSSLQVSRDPVGAVAYGSLATHCAREGYDRARGRATPGFSRSYGGLPGCPLPTVGGSAATTTG